MSTPEGADTIRQLAAKSDILVENFKTDGVPIKVGVGITDVMCGMYAATAILAALRHRDQIGQG